MPLVEIIAAGAAVAQAISQVVPLLNQARSVVLEVDNNTDNTLLSKVSDEHSHGGFAVIPSFEIPPKHADVFGSQSKGGSIGTGTQGSVTYTGDGFTLTISWDNPFFGDNSCDARIAGDNVAKFRVEHTSGVGNTAAHMRYELFDRILANFANQKHAGNPVLIQSRFGSQGNFELLSPLATGSLAAYFRDNDAPGLPWHGPMIFGSNQYSGVTMIQSNFGNPGNLEVIASIGTTLHHFFRDSGPEFQWNGPFPIHIDGTGEPFVVPNPVLIQSRFGNQGNFELIAPEASLTPGEGIVHFFRDNDDSSFPWRKSDVFGRGSSQTDRIGAVTMIQSNFNSPGNLEVIARIGERLAFFFRDSGPAFLWNGPFFM